MKKILIAVVALLAASLGYAETAVGKWKVISKTVIHEGKELDMHAALLKVRPCAAKIVYEFADTGKASLDASACEDESYRKTQEKLWSKMKWKVEGDQLTTSATNFAVGNTYTVTFSGDKMTWKDKNGSTVYQKL